MSIYSFGLAPALLHRGPCGQLKVIAQLLKICPLGFTWVKGLTPGSGSVFMSLPTKGFVMNRKPQETKAFSKDKQLCPIHQQLRSPTLPWLKHRRSNGHREILSEDIFQIIFSANIFLKVTLHMINFNFNFNWL